MSLALFIIFFLLWCLSLVIIVVGLIKPKLVLYWGSQDKKNRGRVFLYYGIPSIVFFIVFISSLVTFGASLPEPTQEEVAAAQAEQKAESERESKNDEEEKANKEAAEKAEEEKRVAQEKAKQEAKEKAKAEESVSKVKASKNSGENKKNIDTSELNKLFINAAIMCEKEKWKNCNDITKDILGTTKENGDAYFLSGLSKTGLLAAGALQDVKEYREVNMLDLIREAQNASTLEEALDQSNQIKNLLKTAISNNKIIIETSSGVYSEFQKADSFNDEIGKEYKTVIASVSYIEKYTTLENKYFSYAENMNTLLNDWIGYSIDWNKAHFKDDESGMDTAWNKMIELESKLDGYEEKLIKSSDELYSFAEKSEINWELADQETENFWEVLLTKYN